MKYTLVIAKSKKAREFLNEQSYCSQSLRDGCAFIPANNFVPESSGPLRKFIKSSEGCPLLSPAALEIACIPWISFTDATLEVKSHLQPEEQCFTYVWLKGKMTLSEIRRLCGCLNSSWSRIFNSNRCVDSHNFGASPTAETSNCTCWWWH